MNRRDLLEGLGMGLGVTTSASAGVTAATGSPQLLDAWFEVHANGDATFVLRFDDPIWETVGFDEYAPAVTFSDHVRFPELPSSAVEFSADPKSEGEQFEASTLIEDERAWIGNYMAGQEDGDTDYEAIADALETHANADTLPDVNQPLRGPRRAVSGEPITEDPGFFSLERKYASYINLLGGYISGFAEVENRSESTTAWLNRRYGQFLRQSRDESTLKYHANSPVVFSDRILPDRSRVNIQISYPPDVTYEMHTVRNWDLAGADKYSSERPEWAQIPKLSHRCDRRLAAITNGFKQVRKTLEDHKRSGLYHILTDEDEYVDEYERRVMTVTGEAVNAVMWDLFGTLIPLGKLFKAGGISTPATTALASSAAKKAILQAGYGPLIKATEEWEQIIMEYQNLLWLQEADAMISGSDGDSGMFGEFKRLERLGYRTLLASETSDILHLLDHIHSAAESADDKRTDYDLYASPVWAGSKDEVTQAELLHQHAENLSEFMQSVLVTARNESLYLQREYMAGQDTDPQPDPEPDPSRKTTTIDGNFEFTYEDVLTLTYRGDESWQSEKLFVSIAHPDGRRGFLWSELAGDEGRVRPGDSVTLRHEMTVRSHSYTFDLEKAIVRVNFEEEHGTIVDVLAKWSGPNAPENYD